MKVLEKILDICKPFKVIVCALILGCICTFIISIILISNTSNSFDEIKNLPRSTELNISNKYKYSYLNDIYDFTKQTVGVDVSEWQGIIDYNKVKKSGVDFVIIRCGFRNSNDEIIEDKYFKRNIEEALANDIKVGVYFFSTANTLEEVLEEAKWVVDRISNYKITYPVVYDLENIGKYSTANLSLEEINKNAKAFLGYIADKGYIGSLYGSSYDLNNSWDLSLFDNYLIWYAHYTTSPNHDINYVMWQYTNKGKIDGISGDVDLNIAYFSYIGK